MSKTAYVVNQIGWEYDDEVYYTSSDQGGHPMRAFAKEQDAIDFAMEKNLDYLGSLFRVSSRHNGLIDYARDLEDILSVSGKMFEQILINHGFEFGIDDNGFWFITPPEDISRNALRMIFDAINLQFYDVYKVEMD